MIVREIVLDAVHRDLAQMPELAEAEGLFLRAPEQGKSDPPGEKYDRQLPRLVAFDNRLDNPR